MRSNRRRHENIVPLTSLAMWIVLALFACGAGLFYVYSKQQLIARGADIRKLEHELRDLRIANEDAHTRISMLASSATLRERRYDKFVPITQDHLVTVATKSTDLRVVSNPKARSE
jgi:hypothetical protein